MSSLLLPKLKEHAKLCWLHRKQFQAMTAASAIFIAGGMKFAWCIYEEPPATTTRIYKQILMISWFMGAILGSMLASMILQKVSKNVVYCSSAALLMSGGMLTFIYPAHIAALFFGSLLEGCAYGLSQVHSLVIVGELADKNLRGLLVANERISLWTGIYAQLLYIRFWYAYPLATSGHTLHVNQLHGLIIACLGFVATLLTMLQRLNSPTFSNATLMVPHIVECGMQEAQPLQKNQTKQQPHFGKTTDITVCERSAQQSKPLHFKLRLLPLLQILVLRGFVALSMSLSFNRAFLTSSWSGFACNTNCLHLLAGLGLLGSVVGGLVVDALGRRRLAVSSLLLGGILIFVAGGIFDHAQNRNSVIMDRLDFEIAASLQLMFQFFTCLGVGVVSSVYLVEAFNGHMKSLCIAAVLSFEHMLQIGFTLMVFRLDYSNGELFFGVGSLSMIFGLVVFFCMPETKLLSLGECLMKFNNVF